MNNLPETFHWYIAKYTGNEKINTGNRKRRDEMRQGLTLDLQGRKMWIIFIELWNQGGNARA